MERNTYEVMHNKGKRADTYESPSREAAVREFKKDYANKLLSKGGQMTVHAYRAGDANSERVPFVVTQHSVEKL